MCELLYYWLEKENCIEKTGFCFSPKYSFVFKDDENTAVLKISKTGIPNIMNGKNILNISAIVGNNGAGKTTLMHSLLKPNMYGKNSNVNYQRLVAVFEIDGCIKVVTNFDKELTATLDDEKLSIHNVNSEYYYPDISRIYVSNSELVDPAVFGSRDGLEHLIITPSKVSTLSNAFYSSFHSEGMDRDENRKIFERYSYYVTEHLGEWSFNQLIMLFYYNKLINTRNSPFAGMMKKRFRVSAFGVKKILEEYKIGYDNKLKENSEDIDYYQRIQDITSKYVDGEDLDIVNRLKMNLCIEYSIWLDGSSIIYSIEQIKDVNGLPNYFDNALRQIEQFENIIMKNTDIVEIDYSKNQEQFIDFCTFIKKVFYDSKIKGGSIILRYLNIGNLGLSSGERAMQNIFSWISVLPEYESLISGKNFHLKDDILILIDEIDLYSHPEWECAIIDYLMSEIQQEYCEKNIQIILSTHSPLCLSDIPRENTIYIKKENEITVCDSNKNHKQTFGSNIYDLLNDSFYLNGMTMGRFARKYVDNLIKEIDECENNETINRGEIEKIQSKVNMIGDVIIRNYLMNRLLKLGNVFERIIILEKTEKRLQEEIKMLKEQCGGYNE